MLILKRTIQAFFPAIFLITAPFSYGMLEEDSDKPKWNPRTVEALAEKRVKNNKREWMTRRNTENLNDRKTREEKKQQKKLKALKKSDPSKCIEKLMEVPKSNISKKIEKLPRKSPKGQGSKTNTNILDKKKVHSSMGFSSPSDEHHKDTSSKNKNRGKKKRSQSKVEKLKVYDNPLEELKETDYRGYEKVIKTGANIPGFPQGPFYEGREKKMERSNTDTQKIKKHDKKKVSKDNLGVVPEEGRILLRDEGDNERKKSSSRR